MTPTEFYKQKAEKIVQRRGLHIPPYRLANLMLMHRNTEIVQ